MQAPEFDSDPAAIALVRGREMLTDHYGGWPSFHDGEVIRLTLERAPMEDTATSNVRSVFSVFDPLKSKSDPDRKQAHTEFLFGGVQDFTCLNWNHQNPICGMSITLAPHGGFEIYWGGCGHEVRFHASSAAVLDLVDLNPFRIRWQASGSA